MAFLDFMNRGSAPQQPSVNQSQQQQQQSSAQKSVQSLPDNVKAEAVEAARPAAELMDKATTPRTGNAQPSMQNTPDNTQARGRSLSMER
jgi:hypothetical protein